MEEPTNNEEETTVRVAVRCRPFNSKEKANGETSCVKIYSDQVVLVNPANSSEEHSFAFDMVIDENSTQESVWVNVGVPILNKAFSGYNGTIFAYGQTGSGKTWSMQGAEGNDLEGIIPRMSSQLFERVEAELKKRQTVQFLITVSYFEIYNEVIFDLLDSSDRKKRSGKGGLEIKEHPVLGVYVKGLQEVVVDSAAKLQSFIDQGMRNRTVASTQMNADSSRSHSVFIINLHQKDVEDESKNVFAKVNLVDLAGSERVKSTGATGSILKEGANINKSLSALGNVINALVEVSKGKGGFIPYRNSKLTRVLQESLGGNSVTAMLAALSPAACNFEETLSTLKYANRAKAIKVFIVLFIYSSWTEEWSDAQCEVRSL
jgi:kinesin family protein 1/kinesin family protein 3/17